MSKRSAQSIAIATSLVPPVAPPMVFGNCAQRVAPPDNNVLRRWSDDMIELPTGVIGI